MKHIDANISQMLALRKILVHRWNVIATRQQLENKKQMYFCHTSTALETHTSQHFPAVAVEDDAATHVINTLSKVQEIRVISRG